MSRNDTANEGGETFRGIERPSVEDIVHASVEVDTSELSPPRTNHVHAMAEQIENRIEAEVANDVDVTKLGNHGPFSHIECERVGMQASLNTSGVSGELADDARDVVVECEDDFFERFEEVKENALA